MNTPVSFSLPYGKEIVEARIPRRYFGGVFSVPEVPPLQDLEGEIRRVLRSPTGGKPLSLLASHSKRVLLLVDDLTRQTPAHRILPLVVEELQAGGCGERDMAILSALGSHRAMTESEMEEKVGADIFRRIRCFNHDFKGPLDYIGNTDLGTPIDINPMLGEYDLVIGIGTIVPHRYCGWSGGGKIVQPGVCGERTITATHLLVAKDEALRLGSESNLALDEIRYVSESAGLKFIVNTICNGSGQVTDVVAGAPVSAHKEGIGKAKRALGVAMPESDVVVVSSYPEDANLWQAMKALYAAQLVVRKGGRIILVSPLHEGAGEHPEIIRLMALGTGKLRRIIEESSSGDMLCVAAAFAEALVMEHALIDIVSDNIGEEQFAGTPIGYYDSLQSALDNACSKLGEKGIVTVLREGPIALPLVVPR